MRDKFKNPIVVGMLALLCCMLWGSAFPCIKIGYQMFEIDGVGSQVLFAGYRFFLSGIFTFIIGCVLEKRVLTMKKSSVLPVFGQGILQTTLQYIFFYIGLAGTTASKGSIINASNAFVSIIAASIILKGEKFTRQKLIGCILGMGGVVIINLTPGAWGDGFSFTGEGFVFLCAVAYGISSVTLKLIANKESAITITAYQLLFGSSILIILGLLLGGKVNWPGMKGMGLFFYLALLTTVAFSLWTTLIKYNPVGRIAVYGFSIPIFGVALSAILLGEEIFTIKNIFALILVSLGIIIVNRDTNTLNQIKHTKGCGLR
ncbi:MAG: DMT family transporter [Suipraeoptans sp.]